MEERIKYLFRKYLNNTCTKEEFEEVFFYLKMEENEPSVRALIREVYDQQRQAHPSGIFIDEAGELKGTQGEDTREKEGIREEVYVQEKDDRNTLGDRRRRIRKRRTLSLALGCFVLLAGAVLWRLPFHRSPPATARITSAAKVLKQATRASENKYLQLPDGSQVWLNAGSTLEFGESFGKEDRKVVLKGEAFFDVTYSEKLPFIIYTGKVSTEVLGTSFNIKAYPDLEKIVVAVKKGKVKVNYADRQVALLTMGQQVSIGNKDNSVKEKKVKADETASWQKGELIYDDYTIGDIVSDLARVYNVKIRIENPAVSNMRISTSFKRQDGVIKALEVLSKLTDTQLLRMEEGYLVK